jgi:hypothetical protein
MAKGKKTGGGSRAGRPNRSTANAREAIAAFVEQQTPRFGASKTWSSTTCRSSRAPR